VQQPDGATDLLTLIGHAIEKLRQCIVLFEAAETDSGVQSIGAVVDEIDGYLEVAEEDPLLRLASMPPNQIRDGLQQIQEELVAVIDDLKQSPSTDAP
jgi:hypothetical protein